MDKRQKEQLQPFAEKFAQMEMMLRESSDEELEVLLEAAQAITPTNCWYQTYTAGKHLQKEILCEQGWRRNERARSEKSAQQRSGDGQ